MRKLPQANVMLGGLVLSAGSALAQGTSDLMPSPPPAAPGAAVPLYPGQPSPPPAQAAPGQAAPGQPGARPSVPTGRIILDDVSGPGEASVSTAEREPETHVVRKGDTLWGISASYFNDPWMWPRLWAMNPSITNPHWIYPGDVVRLRAHEESEVAAAPKPEPEARKAPERAPAVTGIILRQTGFVEPGELKLAGKVVGSREEKIMLATLDEAYVQFSKDKPMRPGERFTVYNPVKEVKHPVSGKKVGDLVQIFGEIEVKSVTEGGIARVVIIDSIEGIERGFRVGPLRRQFKIVEPRPDTKEIVGVVVTTLRPVRLVGSEMLVFLDRGRDHGVEVGNRFLVVRRGDGYQPILATGPVDDHRFPRETIAEVLVVEVRDGLSAGIVTRAIKEARVGDRIETRRGY